MSTFTKAIRMTAGNEPLEASLRLVTGLTAAMVVQTIVLKATNVKMTLDMCEETKRMCDDISALGLHHVGYSPPVELFDPFVSTGNKVVHRTTENEPLEASFGWALGLISGMLVRTILEGSTIAMKAINVNSAAMMRKAVGYAPRSKRAGDAQHHGGIPNHISFMWSVESGALDAAKAMIVDWLTKLHKQGRTCSSSPPPACTSLQIKF